MKFLDTVDLGVLNSATKYPSILTYHALDSNNGRLIDGKLNHLWPKTEPIIVTEKVDGTNGRIVVLPDGSYLIGSREEFFYASGDRIQRSDLGIVPFLKPIAEAIATDGDDHIRTYYLEVFGGGGKHRVGQNARQYTGTGEYGARLFDITSIDPEVLAWDRVTVSAWRERGGQNFFDEVDLEQTAAYEKIIPLTPRLKLELPIFGGDLPHSVEGMEAFLWELIPDGTLVALDDTAGGVSEGVVIRTEDRSVVAKIRFEDYKRTRRVHRVGHARLR